MLDSMVQVRSDTGITYGELKKEKKQRPLENLIPSINALFENVFYLNFIDLC